MPALLLLVFPLAIALEALRAVTRRKLVEAWVTDNGWTLRRLKYRLEPLGWNWLVYYWLEATDSSGSEVEGVVESTGFIRRKVRWSGRSVGPTP